MDKALVQLVRKRAGNACEYCLMPQSAHVLTFPIDHIIARQHDGDSSEDNLALSCVRCNSFKGPNIAGISVETKQVVRLFNPRVDAWSEHFEFEYPEIVGRTEIGQVTVKLLMMNHPDYIALRTSLIAEGVFPPRE